MVTSVRFILQKLLRESKVDDYLGHWRIRRYVQHVVCTINDNLGRAWIYWDGLCLDGFDLFDFDALSATQIVMLIARVERSIISSIMPRYFRLMLPTMLCAMHCTILYKT